MRHKRKFIHCIYIGFYIILTLFSSTIPISGETILSSKSGNTTIILVRHAEKVSDSEDPELSVKGKERALELEYILKHIVLDAVYSTKFKRTRQTVSLIAKNRDLPVIIYDHKNKDFMNMILKNHKGGTALISGHSNSTPAQINLLLKENKFKSLDHKIYDNIFIVTISDKKKISVLRLRFGERTPE